MPKRIHRVDYSADEFLAGVVGELSAAEVGVYWMICSLIYSRRRAIPDDVRGLTAKFRGTDPRTIRAALERLVALGKVTRDEGELRVNRCLDELEMASNRIRTASENGSKGGRPSKDSNDLTKPGGFPFGLQDEKLSPSPVNKKQKNPFPVANLSTNHIETEPLDDLFAENPDTQPSDGRYAFEGWYVRLNHRDYKAWKKAYPNVDLDAQLQGYDDWLRSDEGQSARKQWFRRLSAKLGKENQTLGGKNFEHEHLDEGTKRRQAYREIIKKQDIRTQLLAEERCRHHSDRRDDEGLHRWLDSVIEDTQAALEQLRAPGGVSPPIPEPDWRENVDATRRN